MKNAQRTSNVQSATDLSTNPKNAIAAINPCALIA